jgi:hypothetical protein
MELLVPAWRGWLAKATNLFPPLMMHLYGPLLRRGLKHLAERRMERTARDAREARA